MHHSADFIVGLIKRFLLFLVQFKISKRCHKENVFFFFRFFVSKIKGQCFSVKLKVSVHVHVTFQ